MSGDRSRLNGIEAKWKAERKVNATDVTWLISQANQAEMMRVADAMRQRTSGRSPIDDALSGLLGAMR